MSVAHEAVTLASLPVDHSPCAHGMERADSGRSVKSAAFTYIAAISRTPSGAWDAIEWRAPAIIIDALTDTRDPGVAFWAVFAARRLLQCAPPGWLCMEWLGPLDALTRHADRALRREAAAACLELRARGLAAAGAAAAASGEGTGEPLAAARPHRDGRRRH
jgi:hypothetical protein